MHSIPNSGERPHPAACVSVVLIYLNTARAGPYALRRVGLIGREMQNAQIDCGCRLRLIGRGIGASHDAGPTSSRQRHDHTSAAAACGVGRDTDQRCMRGPDHHPPHPPRRSQIACARWQGSACALYREPLRPAFVPSRPDAGACAYRTWCTSITTRSAWRAADAMKMCCISQR